MSAKKKADPANEIVLKDAASSQHKMRDLGKSLNRRTQARSVVLGNADVHSRMVSIWFDGKTSDDRMKIYRAVKTGFPLQSVLDMVDNSQA